MAQARPAVSDAAIGESDIELSKRSRDVQQEKTVEESDWGVSTSISISDIYAGSLVPECRKSSEEGHESHQGDGDREDDYVAGERHGGRSFDSDGCMTEQVLQEGQITCCSSIVDSRAVVESWWSRQIGGTPHNFHVSTRRNASLHHDPPNNHNRDMAAPTVYNDVAAGVEPAGQLFAGLKFWVAQRVPMRMGLLADIKANGGEVVPLEKHADYLIADHIRPKYCPPGSLSYEFVTKSVERGELQDPEDHRAGPPLGEAREPGAIHRPAKGSRAAYTTEEDRILYKWVRDTEAAGGGVASGNEIYKRLEAKVCAVGVILSKQHG